MCVCVCVQDQASEAMEIFDELMESEVSIIVPHIVEIVHFCLEVSNGSLRSTSGPDVVLWSSISP